MTTTDKNPAIRLLVWRPVRWSSRHQLLDTKAGHPADASNFHESIYCWEMQDNPLDAVENPELSEKIDQEIINAFRPELSPTDRCINALPEKLALLDQIITDNPVPWMGSTSPFASKDAHDDNADVEPRLNRLLAFRHILQWVYDTFRTVPDASVTFR